MSRLLFKLLSALALVAGLTPALAGTIVGTALIRERIALPPDAELVAQLLDASAPNGPELVMATARRQPAGQSPFQFQIDYDGSRMQPGQRYIVRVTVGVRGQVLFQAEPPVAVAGDGSDPSLQVMLTATAAAAFAGANPPGPAPVGPAGQIGPIGPIGPFVPAAPIVAVPGLGNLPASFAGDLPGANGAGHWQLDLLADGRYQLRQTPLNRRDRNRIDETGRWSWERDRNRVVLTGGREGTLYLELAGNGALRRLDARGRRIDTTMTGNDLLVRQGVPVAAAAALPAPQRIAVNGMLTFLADGARITLCSDGRSLPVSTEADFRALESAYRAARPQSGQAVLVTGQGQIAWRPSAEPGRPPVAVVVVDRFEQAWPRETCGQPQAATPLRGTYWKLVRLNGRPSTADDRQREPHLIVSADGRQVSGSGGCNRMNGAVEVNGDRIAIRQLSATRMACAGAAMSQETAYFDTLERGTRWRVTGSHLEWLDDRGNVLARFEAAAPR